MSRTMRKAYRKYLKISYLFMTGNPSAEYKWGKFIVAENGWSLASDVVQHPEKYGRK